MSLFLSILASVVFTLTAGLGVVLQMVTLPGTWVIVAVALLYQGGAAIVGAPLPFNWWVLGSAVLMAILAEIIETATGAAGAAMGGARRRGALGALVGSLLGALFGLIGLAFIPVIGALIGAVAGAGLGAFIGEMSYGDKVAKEAVAPAAGAALGRVAGVAGKIAIAAAMWLMLAIDAFV